MRQEGTDGTRKRLLRHTFFCSLMGDALQLTSVLFFYLALRITRSRTGSVRSDLTCLQGLSALLTTQQQIPRIPHQTSGMIPHFSDSTACLCLEFMIAPCVHRSLLYYARTSTQGYRELAPP